MFALYSRTGLVLRNNFWLFAAIAAIGVLADNLGEFSPGLGGKLVVYALITFFSHRLILSGASTTLAESFRPGLNSALVGPMLPFMLRFAGLLLIGAVIWAICAFSLWSFFASNEKSVIFLITILSLIPTALLSYGVLSLVGTVLPAAAAGQDASFGRAYEIGRQRFGRTYFRLITGNLLFSIANVVLTLGLAVLLPVSQSAPLVYATEWLLTVLSIIPLLLTATALCMAFEEGQSNS